jgi:UDP-2,4-diacetamido-2,4,6-trideoxy-beta-L-altropyranose hydrolase
MKLLVRADASSTIGVGHVMRCLALAQAWQEAGGTALFAMAEGAEALVDRLTAEGLLVRPLPVQVGSAEDARQTLALAEREQVAWLALDGYRFDAEYQRRLTQGQGRLLMLDDFGQTSHYCADLVLNQNAHADAAFYPSREATTELLLGLDYVLLRREFRQHPPQPKNLSQPARHLLLTLGGGDPDNLTGRVIEELSGIDLLSLETIAVVGASNPHRPRLEALCHASERAVQLRSNVADMSELYAWADLAVTGGGSTLWELAHLGVPALTLILAVNQEASSRRLDRLGAIRCLGYPQDLGSGAIAAAVVCLGADSEQRQRMAERGRRLVDGRGALRVVRRMLAALNQGDAPCTMS